jgi:transposase
MPNPKSTKRRRQYSEEFKRRAVLLSHSSERTVQQVADSLGIHVSLIVRWRKIYTPAGDITQTAEKDKEITELRMKVAELTEENDMLKKASAFFARNQKI